jgi:integrase
MWVEYDGKPITSQMRRAWRGARMLAGLGPDVTPHILKHTCATLMLQRGISTWRVARLLGTSEAVIERTYGHHAMDDLTAALNVWSERPK